MALRSRLEEDSAPGSEGEAFEDDAFEVRLRIDHTLGREFPADRRDALVSAQRALSVGREEAVERFALGEISPDEYASRLQSLVAQHFEECRKILDTAELEAFTGLEGDESPRLLLDPSLIRR